MYQNWITHLTCSLLFINACRIRILHIWTVWVHNLTMETSNKQSLESMALNATKISHLQAKISQKLATWKEFQHQLLLSLLTRWLTKIRQQNNIEAQDTQTMTNQCSKKRIRIIIRLTISCLMWYILEVSLRTTTIWAHIPQSLLKRSHTIECLSNRCFHLISWRGISIFIALTRNPNGLLTSRRLAKLIWMTRTLHWRIHHSS